MVFDGIARDVLTHVRIALHNAEQEIKLGSQNARASLSEAYEWVMTACQNYEIVRTAEPVTLLGEYDKLNRKLTRQEGRN